MAATWIKIQHGLIDKPEVMQMADDLDVSPHEVVGHLVAFWLWVDVNLSPDCPAVKGTKKGIDRVAGRDGFADSLISVGWLRVEDGFISVPNYDTHLSKSAKARAEEQRKKANQRQKQGKPDSENNSDGPRDCPANVPEQQGQKQGLEKRREEYKNTTHKSSKTDHLRPQDVSESLWSDWVALRKEKRATVSQTVVDGLRSKADKIGWSLSKVLEKCVVSGWQGFEIAWLDKSELEPEVDPLAEYEDLDA